MATSTVFETGAKSAAPNDLVLTVMNDGAVYAQRLHYGYAMISGSDHAYKLREIVQLQAAQMRAAFGSKFSADAITDAINIIHRQTVRHCMESIFSGWDGETITVQGRKWWDKINGNTYFSACICIGTDSGMRHVNIPMEYGCGDYWQHAAMQTLRAMGFNFPENVARSSFPIIFTGGDYTLKRNMFTGLYNVTSL